MIVRVLPLLLAAQLVAAGMGVWVHSRIVLGLASRAAHEETLDELRQLGRRLASGAWWEGDGRPADVPAGTNVAILTADATVRRNVSGDAPLETGRRIAWTPYERARAASAGTPGGFALEGERQLGAIVPLANGDRLLVYRSERHVPPWTAGFRRVLPELGGLTVLTILALAAVPSYLVIRRAQEVADAQRERIQNTAARRQSQLVRTRDAVVFGLAKLAESRDEETGWHLERITLYSVKLARALRDHPDFREEITPTFVRLIETCSPLHDIGKVGIEDAILCKPGKLTPEERKRMEEHSHIGADCLRQIQQRLGESDFLQVAREIVLHHHERWDGSGYPVGLAGNEIPLSARIVALADVYDALSSRRRYKDPMPHEECVEWVRSQAGAHFDPRVVDAFLQLESEFAEVSVKYRPTEDEPQAAETEPETTPVGKSRDTVQVAS